MFSRERNVSLAGSTSSYNQLDSIFIRSEAVTLSNTSWPAQLFTVLIVTAGVCANKEAVKKNRKRIKCKILFIG